MRRDWVGSPTYRAALSVLIQARNDAKLTQRELAARIGRPPSYVGKVEVGERRLDFVEFLSWSQGIGLEPGELMRRVAAAHEADDNRSDRER